MVEPSVRFWSKVDKTSDCWLWTARRTRHGYGVFGVDGGRIIASRYSWTLANGPIPDGLFVLHRCDNPPCVNPAHLWLGTLSDNMWDASRKGRIGAKRVPATHCKRGHAFDEANTGYTPNGRRRCRRCMNVGSRAWRLAHPETVAVWRRQAWNRRSEAEAARRRERYRIAREAGLSAPEARRASQRTARYVSTTNTMLSQAAAALEEALG